MSLKCFPENKLKISSKLNTAWQNLVTPCKILSFTFELKRKLCKETFPQIWLSCYCCSYTLTCSSNVKWAVVVLMWSDRLNENMFRRGKKNDHVTKALHLDEWRHHGLPVSSFVWRHVELQVKVKLTHSALGYHLVAVHQGLCERSDEEKICT